MNIIPNHIYGAKLISPEMKKKERKTECFYTQKIIHYHENSVWPWPTFDPEKPRYSSQEELATTFLLAIFKKKKKLIEQKLRMEEILVNR